MAPPAHDVADEPRSPPSSAPPGRSHVDARSAAAEATSASAVGPTWAQDPRPPRGTVDGPAHGVADEPRSLSSTAPPGRSHVDTRSAAAESVLTSSSVVGPTWAQDPRPPRGTVDGPAHDVADEPRRPPSSAPPARSHVDARSAAAESVLTSSSAVGPTWVQDPRHRGRPGPRRRRRAEEPVFGYSARPVPRRRQIRSRGVRPHQILYCRSHVGARSAATPRHRGRPGPRYRRRAEEPALKRSARPVPRRRQIRSRGVRPHQILCCRSHVGARSAATPRHRGRPGPRRRQRAEEPALKRSARPVPRRRQIRSRGVRSHQLLCRRSHVGAGSAATPRHRGRPGPRYRRRAEALVRSLDDGQCAPSSRVVDLCDAGAR
jgi:hypothetical protein